MSGVAVSEFAGSSSGSFALYDDTCPRDRRPDSSIVRANRGLSREGNPQC